MHPQKGTIAKGSDADLVIFDPQKKVTLQASNLQTNCDWSPYEGWKLTGYPIITIARGSIVVKDGQFIGEVGRGRFLHRNAHGKI